MRPTDLRAGGTSRTGRGRDHDEDAYTVEPPLVAVADGMGGHEGGEVASRLVVEALAGAGREAAARPGLLDVDDGTALLTGALTAGHDALVAHAAEHEQRTGRPWTGGTTVVAALLVDRDGEPCWLLAHVGDSRAYALRGHRLERLTADHSLVEELVRTGAITEDEAATHPERHVVTRALGAGPAPPADVLVVPLAEAERLLLCTDGVSGALTDDDDLGAVLGGSPHPQDAARDVVDAAVEAGGRDDATAVVVDAPAP